MSESYGDIFAIGNSKTGNSDAKHPIDRYVIDFYCPEARLAIELDGGGHNCAGRESLDQERTRFLASEDIVVLRFWNHQVTEQLGQCSRDNLVGIAATRKPSP